MGPAMIGLEDLGVPVEYTGSSAGWTRVPIKATRGLYYDVSPEGKVYYAGVKIPEEPSRVVRLAAWPFYEGEI